MQVQVETEQETTESILVGSTCRVVWREGISTCPSRRLPLEQASLIARGEVFKLQNVVCHDFTAGVSFCFKSRITNYKNTAQKSPPLQSTPFSQVLGFRSGLSISIDFEGLDAHPPRSISGFEELDVQILFHIQGLDVPVEQVG